MFNHLATLVTILAGIIWLGESLEWFHFAGTGMIIAGLIGATMVRPESRLKKTKKRKIGCFNTPIFRFSLYCRAGPPCGWPRQSF